MERPTIDYKRQSAAYLAHLFPTISCRAIGLVLKHHQHSFTNAFLCLLDVEKTGEIPFATSGNVTVFIKQQRVKHEMNIRNVTLQREIELFENVIKEKDEQVPVVESNKKKTSEGQRGICARLFCCFSG